MSDATPFFNYISIFIYLPYDGFRHSKRRKKNAFKYLRALKQKSPPTVIKILTKIKSCEATRV